MPRRLITCIRCGREGVQQFVCISTDPEIWECRAKQVCLNRQSRGRRPEWVLLRRSEPSGHRTWEGPYISLEGALGAMSTTLGAYGVARMLKDYRYG